MSRLLYKLGRASASKPLAVILTWVLLLAVSGYAFATHRGELHDDFSMPGTEAQQGLETLEQVAPEFAGTSARVVIADDDGDVTDRLKVFLALQDSMSRLPQVSEVTDYIDGYQRITHISPSHAVGYFDIYYEVPKGDLDHPLENLKAAVDEALADTQSAGLQVAIGGDAVDRPEAETNEVLGIIVAVVIMLVLFGSLLATAVPIAVALTSVAIGMTGIFVVADLTDISTFTPTLAVLLGLAVGIDYSLFIVTRHREFMRDGHDHIESAGRAVATAGGAVCFAGVTVMIAICGVAVVGIPLLTVMGIASAWVVGVAVSAAVTLVPALLGLIGARIGQTKGAEAGNHTHDETRVSARWARAVERHPIIWLLAAVVLLGTLAIPNFSMQLGMIDASSKPVGSEQRIAYDLLEAGFGPGFNGPLVVAIESKTGASSGQLNEVSTQIETAIKADPGVVAAIRIAQSDDAIILGVLPTTSPQDPKTSKLLHRLRAEAIPSVTKDQAFPPDVQLEAQRLQATAANEGLLSAIGNLDPKTYQLLQDHNVFKLTDSSVEILSDPGTTSAQVTGLTAFLVDLSDRVSERLVILIACVVGLSFTLLLLVFRSLFVPTKAAIANILAISASYGVVIAVFQWGWGASLIGLHETVPVVPFVPVLMFAVLFGLSMDYEVLMLARIKEEYSRQPEEAKNAKEAVIKGLGSSGQVITAAAAIMIAVFGAAMFSADPIVKMFGVGLSVAVLLDATIVRMVFVPAAMALLDHHAWYLPKWLRKLPNFDIEAEHLIADLDRRTIGTPGAEPDSLWWLTPDEDDFSLIGAIAGTDEPANFDTAVLQRNATSGAASLRASYSQRHSHLESETASLEPSSLEPSWLAATRADASAVPNVAASHKTQQPVDSSGRQTDKPEEAVVVLPLTGKPEPAQHDDEEIAHSSRAALLRGIHPSTKS